MFSRKKDTFEYPQQKGTSALRAHIRQKYISDDEFIIKMLQQYQLYWKYYENEHWAENNDKLVSFNYVRSFIDKANKFFIGKKGFETNIIRYDGEKVDEAKEKSLESLINYNWRKNGKLATLKQITQMGGVTGNSYIFLSVKGEGLEQFIHYRLLDTRQVVPVFLNGRLDVVEKYQIIQPLAHNERGYVQFITEYAKDNTRTFYRKEAKKDAPTFEEKNETNELGFIPIVHIENKPNASGYGGISDVVDIIKLNKFYNELSEDLKAIIDYYAEPTTVITGGFVGQLKKGAGNIWSGLPADASVFNLGLGEDMGASFNYLGLIKDAMFELGSMPEIAFGKKQNVSNTSAAALQILYQPLIDLADDKSVAYGEGLQKLHEMTVRMYKVSIPNHPMAANVSLDDLNTHYYEPIFTYGLPRDRFLLLQEADMELRNHLTSRQQVMERLAVKDIPKVKEEIDEDVKWRRDNELTQADGGGGSGGPNNQPGGVQ